MLGRKLHKLFIRSKIFSDYLPANRSYRVELKFCLLSAKTTIDTLQIVNDTRKRKRRKKRNSWTISTISSQKRKRKTIFTIRVSYGNPTDCVRNCIHIISLNFFIYGLFKNTEKRTKTATGYTVFLTIKWLISLTIVYYSDLARSVNK